MIRLSISRYTIILLSIFLRKAFASLICDRQRQAASHENSHVRHLVSNDGYFSIDVPTGEEQQENVTKMIHETFMDLALKEAKRAGEKGEVPIGALIVKEFSPPPPSSRLLLAKKSDDVTKQRTFQVISTGHNEVESLHDASAHAEMQAMRSASSSSQNWRLLNATLYSTLEPCPMCLSAAQAFRVSKIVYGAPDLRLGAVGTYINLLELAEHPFHPNMHVVAGIRKESSSKLLIDFFRERRKRKKEKKKLSSSSEKGEKIISGGRKRKSRIRHFLSRIFRRKKII